MCMSNHSGKGLGTKRPVRNPAESRGCNSLNRAPGDKNDKECYVNIYVDGFIANVSRI